MNFLIMVYCVLTMLSSLIFLLYSLILYYSIFVLEWSEAESLHNVKQWHNKTQCLLLVWMNLYIKCLSRQRQSFWMSAGCPVIASSTLISQEQIWNLLAKISNISSSRCLEVSRADDSPKTVLAGTDSLLSQKDTWDRMTVMMQGRYVWITK